MSATTDGFRPEQFAELVNNGTKFAEVIAGTLDEVRTALTPLVQATAFVRAAVKATSVEGRTDETHKDGVCVTTHAVTVKFATEADAMVFTQVVAMFAPRPTFEQVCEMLNLQFTQESGEAADASDR